MKMIEETRMVLCISPKDKSEKRKYNRRHIASNISLNLISASVLPQNVCWSDMEGFEAKKFGPFRFKFRNADNEIVAGMEFYITYNCKGKYNSSGQYLAEVTISPYDIFANSGYEFTCNVTASDPINYGTNANPIAGVVLKVQMQVQSCHKLKANQLYSLENSIESEVLINSDDPAVEKELAATSYSSIYKASIPILPASRFQHTVKKVSSKISHLCRNGFYTQEQYVNVLICGDSQVSILSAYGY